MSAYCLNEMENPAGKTLTHISKEGFKKGIDTDLDILYSTIAPSDTEVEEKVIQEVNEETDPLKTEPIQQKKQKKQNKKTEKKEKKKSKIQSKLTSAFADPEKRTAERERKRRAEKEVMNIEEKENGKYEVKGKYTVNMANRSCTCPDYMFRDLKCKHIHKVESYIEKEKERI